jgi:hypothetical protein
MVILLWPARQSYRTQDESGVINVFALQMEGSALEGSTRQYIVAQVAGLARR